MGGPGGPGDPVGQFLLMKNINFFDDNGDNVLTLDFFENLFKLIHSFSQEADIFSISVLFVIFSISVLFVKCNALLVNIIFPNTLFFVSVIISVISNYQICKHVKFSLILLFQWTPFSAKRTAEVIMGSSQF